MIDVLESWFGTYPFVTYGALVVDDGFGFGGRDPDAVVVPSVDCRAHDVE